MVNEEPPADSGSGVNFNVGQEAIDMSEETSQELDLMSPEEVGQTMKPEGMKARIAENDLRRASRCGIFGKNCLNIFFQNFKQDTCHFLLYKPAAAR